MDAWRMEGTGIDSDGFIALLQEAGVLLSESTQTHWENPSSDGQQLPTAWTNIVSEPIQPVDGPLVGTQGITKRKRPSQDARSSIKELEEQLSRLQTSFSMQSKVNMMASERVRILELVLAVKDEQVARVQQLRQGLLGSFNPLQALGMTPKDLESSSPGFLMNKFLANTNRLAERLAAVLAKAGNGVSMADVMRHGVHVSGVQPASSVQDAAAQEMQLLLEDMAAMQTSFKFMFFMKPQLLLASSMHVDRLRLLTDLEDQGDTRATATPAASSANQEDVPGIAPESHWRGVVSQMHLTDHQRLQAAVLWEIISKGRAGVLRQRAALGKSMSKALQQPHKLLDPASPGASSSHQQQQDDITGAVWRDAQQLQHEAKLLDTLDRTLVKERALVLLAAEVFYTNIITPPQCAMVLVASYPFIPDDLAILHAASAEYNNRLQDESS